MNEIPNFRPADRITNPELFRLARQRWPGVPVTSEMLTDIAKLTGEAIYVPATREAVAAGLAEIAKDRRATTARNEITREYQRMGFNPDKNYSTKE